MALPSATGSSCTLRAMGWPAPGTAGLCPSLQTASMGHKTPAQLVLSGSFQLYLSMKWRCLLMRTHRIFVFQECVSMCRALEPFCPLNPFCPLKPPQPVGRRACVISVGEHSMHLLLAWLETKSLAASSYACHSYLLSRPQDSTFLLLEAVL